MTIDIPLTNELARLLAARLQLTEDEAGTLAYTVLTISGHLNEIQTLIVPQLLSLLRNPDAKREEILDAKLVVHSPEKMLPVAAVYQAI